MTAVRFSTPSTMSTAMPERRSGNGAGTSTGGGRETVTGAGAARRGAGRAPNWNGLRDGAAPAAGAARRALSRRAWCSTSEIAAGSAPAGAAIAARDCGAVAWGGGDASHPASAVAPVAVRLNFQFQVIG